MLNVLKQKIDQLPSILGKIAPHTYHIQQIIMSIAKMLIEVFLFIKPFSTVSTFPFIYIYTDLVLFLISVKVIV